MNATTTPEAETYLAAVRAELADLPDADREELLEDLEQHLVEVAAEADGPLDQQLGSPAEYAAELRASAGLGSGPRRSRFEQFLARDVARVKALKAHPRLTAVRSFVAELQPGWWLVRAYALLLAYSLAHVGAGAGFPIPRILGNRTLGLIVLAFAVVGSVWLGRRRTMGWRIVDGAVTALALFATLAAVGMLNAASASPATVYDEGTMTEGVGDYYGDIDGGLHRAAGGPVTNIYPYDVRGRLLHDVRLYDQNGKPLEIVREYTPSGRRVLTSYPTDLEGRPVTNAFPQQQAVRGRAGNAAAAPADLSVPPLVAEPEQDPSPQATAGSETPDAPKDDRPRGERPQDGRR